MFFRDRGKNFFSAGCLVFFIMFKDAWGLLFYSKRKVWQISEKMSTLGGSYDKISPMWLRVLRHGCPIPQNSILINCGYQKLRMIDLPQKSPAWYQEKNSKTLLNKNCHKHQKISF